MKKWLKVVLVSICLGLLATLVSGVPSKSGAIVITTSPDYCTGPDVVGYKCPNVAVKAEGVSRGFPFSFRYEEVTIQKQDNFLKPKILDNGAAQFSVRNFVLDIITWSIIAGVIVVVRGKLKSKVHK